MTEGEAEDPTSIKRITSNDETLVYEYDVETVQQSSEWRSKNEPKTEKPNWLKALKGITAKACLY